MPKLLEMQGNGPFVLAGWSLGGALAYACAIGLKEAGADVRFVGLIDAVRPGEEIPQTKEETRARWDRYARFAERTFNVEVPPIPYEQLEELDDEGQVKFVLDAVSQSGVQIPGGIIEHQRTSYLDQRALDTAEIQPYDGHVTLYMADRYHDDAIFFEPRYATRKPDGGWGEFVADLEVVPDRGRAHPGHRRAVHCEGRRAYERGAEPNRGQPERSGEAGEVTNKTTAELLAELREKLELAKEPGGEKAIAKREQEGHSERPRPHPRAARSGQLPGDRRAVQDARRSRRRSSATAWSPATAPSTADRSACSATTRRCSRARSARCSAARSPS